MTIYYTLQFKYTRRPHAYISCPVYCGRPVPPSLCPGIDMPARRSPSTPSSSAALCWSGDGQELENLRLQYCEGPCPRPACLKNNWDEYVFFARRAGPKIYICLRLQGNPSFQKILMVVFGPKQVNALRGDPSFGDDIQRRWRYFLFAFSATTFFGYNPRTLF